jgi:hypothetical protein
LNLPVSKISGIEKIINSWKIFESIFTNVNDNGPAVIEKQVKCWMKPVLSDSR